MTLFYDHKVYRVQRPTFEAYELYLKKQIAGGSTNFINVFDEITKVSLENYQ